MNGPRQYPARPIVGVGAVIVDAGKVVLVKRRYEPLAGRWSLPGGTLEVGETLKAAVIREMREETGLDVEVGPLLEVFDRIITDDAQRVRYHFVLVDYLCWPVGGRLEASSDVEEAVLVGPEAFAEYDLTENAESLIAQALAVNRQLAPRT